MTLNRRTFFFLSLATLVGFSALGMAVIWIFSLPSLNDLLFKTALKWQLIYGTGYGVSLALIAISVAESKALEESTRFFKGFIQNSDIKYLDAFFASVCAGIGEEMFFRGALQPFLGIWLTAIIFVAIHGYLSLKDMGIFLYGLLMVFMTAGFGYFTNWLGIISAMIAHAVFDAIIFWHLLRTR
ncbi:MAG: CPBP family intramembrane metalloprotease [Sphingobacteriales bacterium]|nr:MAG: CPBP family intramembrane metalloprotease [Sphingobacteriales bacterium]